ncbi:MAG TPA: VWA domain-containing protein [Vicinamibacterales bacterium]|nr:VWA domain-containing protein [Vicinamibacterales bacterium]
MKYRYSRFIASLADDVDIDKLMSRLSDLFLSSGFGNPHDPQSDDDRAMQALYDAILDALLNGGALSDEMAERLFSHDGTPEGIERQRQQIDQLVQQLIERLGEQGYISLTGKPDRQQLDGPGGGEGESGQARFEVTDKALDFLGYRALRDLLGSMGRSAAGRHDTRDLDTGIDAGGPPREYEFGDTLNLDAAATVLNAVKRSMSGSRAFRPGASGGAGAPPYESGSGGIDVDYEDLMVNQGDYQSSCATVLLLDCSHSMVLYGEDRFTPAKRVAMALSSLIRHQYPGDTLQAVLFHDSAEEVPLARLGRVKVGPYYTNTCEGLRLARRLLERQRKDMRQIVMITDGKPSAVTRPDGRIYRNAFGLDPLVLRETFAEVAACRRAGIMINTFMLARDYDLVAFVRRVARISRGKAYFTTPYTLGQYVLQDFLTNKTKTIH